MRIGRATKPAWSSASSALAAYGFSRLQWKGRDKLFVLLLATMMIPYPVILVPIFGLF